MKQNRIRPIDRRRRLALECLETRLPLTLDFAHGSEQPVAAPHPGAQHLLPLTSQVVSEGPTHVDKNPRTVPTKRPRPMPEPEGEFSPSIPSGSSRPAADVPTPTNGPSRPSSEPIPSRTPASSLDGSTGKGGSNLLGNPGSSLPSRPEANFRGEASGAISPNGPSVAVSETVPRQSTSNLASFSSDAISAGSLPIHGTTTFSSQWIVSSFQEHPSTGLTRSPSSLSQEMNHKIEGAFPSDNSLTSSPKSKLVSEASSRLEQSSAAHLRGEVYQERLHHPSKEESSQGRTSWRDRMAHRSENLVVQKREGNRNRKGDRWEQREESEALLSSSGRKSREVSDRPQAAHAKGIRFDEGVQHAFPIAGSIESGPRASLKLASVGSSNDATLSSEAVSNEGEDTSVGNVLTEAAFVPLTFVVTLGWWVSRKKRQVQGVESVPERTSPPNR